MSANQKRIATGRIAGHISFSLSLSPQCVEMTYFYDDGARYVNAVSFKDNNEKKKEKKRKEKHILAYFPSYRQFECYNRFLDGFRPIIAQLSSFVRPWIKTNETGGIELRDNTISLWKYGMRNFFKVFLWHTHWEMKKKRKEKERERKKERRKSSRSS